MDRSRIGIVIPALNESASIVPVVTAASRFGVPIVVDDASTDSTAELAANHGATVISHSRVRGYDGALNSGFAKAAEIGCEAIVTIDADGQHDPSLLQRFIAALEGGADVVIGVRSRRQRLAEHAFAWYTSRRYGITDPLCGMKAYRTAVYTALGHFDSYKSIGTELALFAARRGYSVAQVPFNVRERKGAPRFGRSLSGNLKIVRAMCLSTWHSR
jgi:glycosyltransferase involved in cell wall biosynthesis